MALAWTGEDEVETVIAAIEATAGFAADAEEAIVITLLGALVEAIYQGQISGNARSRWAETIVDTDGNTGIAPVVGTLLMQIASQAHILRNELGKWDAGTAPTLAEYLAAAEGDGYDMTNLAPVH